MSSVAIHFPKMEFTGEFSTFFIQPLDLGLGFLGSFIGF